MNTRRQKYKRNRLKGMVPLNAAIAAGYSVSTARAKAYRIERSEKVGLDIEFEKQGLTDNKLVEHALLGLKANRMQSCDVYIGEDGKLNENSNDFIEVADWNARHRYFHSICQMTNKIQSGSVVNNTNKIQVNLTVNHVDVEERLSCISVT